MKIYFDNCNFGSRSGPNTFASRLAHAFHLRGHTLADSSDYDVAIVFIESTHLLNKNKPYVHRLDGIWFKPNEIHVKNVKIRSTYDQANAVVFQSQFNQKQITNWWGTPKNHVVIPNGINLFEVKSSIDSATIDLSKLGSGKKYVSSANWHNQKRLGSNVELFAKLKEQDPNSILIVLGSGAEPYLANVDPKLKKSIYLAGNLPHHDCLQIYSQCDYMLHLAWLDHCPNVVVEALACGLPVACSFDGGTKELVGSFGTVFTEDTPYQGTPEDYDNPPRISVSTELVQPDPGLLQDVRQNLDIMSAVEKYESLFKSIM
jgi:glycosyltransferase involved in cell wall biosynthesis